MSSRDNPCIVCMADYAREERGGGPWTKSRRRRMQWILWYHHDQPKVGTCSSAHTADLTAAILIDKR